MRRRVVLAIALVAAASVALFALPLALAVQRVERDDELLRLQRDTIAATRQIDVTAVRADQVELPASSDSRVVVDLAGRRIAGSGPIATDLVSRARGSGKPVYTARGGRLQVAVPIVSSERITGVLLASRSADRARSRARHVWLLLLALAAGVVVLASLAAVVLGRRLAGPIERLAVAARRLGDGDFSARAPRAGIAEPDAVAEALDVTAGRLDAVITRERAFSADASHQLRTPLAALRVELEGRQLKDADPGQLAGAIAQVDRLETTIETLLAVARDLPRSPMATDVTALADAACERWRPRLAAVGRVLRIDAAGEQIARASEPVLHEILDVLLGNALDHGAGAVTLTVRETHGWLAIDVEDEGPGISGDGEAIFARRSGSGHGIGLDLARSLAHAEGGRLQLTRSQPGARFSLLLPRAAD